MKVAFIIQRFGNQVTGGAEKHCQKIVEKLKTSMDVEVLTTCALDYVTWKNHFTPGNHSEDGVTIKRFPVDFERETHMFNRCYDFLVNLHVWHGFERGYDLKEVLHPLEIKDAIENKNQHRPKNFSLELVDSMESLWMEAQGPCSSSLKSYVEKNKDHYDAFIFFSYNYWTTFSILPLVKEKAILIPTAHPDPSLAFRIFQNFFKFSKKILFNTIEEKDLVQSMVGDQTFAYTDIVGVGVDIPSNISPRLAPIKYRIDGPYVIAIGRLDESKGYARLFEIFIAYKKNYRSALKLVIVGEGRMLKPIHRDIIFLGYVKSEEDKFSLIKGSQCLVTASAYESLSIVLLEAWSVKVPVLVEESCQVLRGQCERSGGGLTFFDEKSFKQAIDSIKNTSRREELAHKGYEFVTKYYSWDIIISKYKKAVLASPGS